MNEHLTEAEVPPESLSSVGGWEVPEGWQLMPINPTNYMLEVAKARFMCAAQSLMGFNADRLAYKTLLENAPKPPTRQRLTD
jgi:hypothetical protein